MNKLLEYQIRKFLGDTSSLPKNCQEFLKAVQQTYQDHESDYERLERAYDKIVNEMAVHDWEKKLILQSVGNGIIRVDLKGNITFSNPAALRMLGYAPHELLGRSFHKIILHSHSDGTPYWEQTSPLRRALDNHASYRQTHEVFWRKGHVSFHVEYTCTPVLDQNEVKGAVIVFKNISEQILTKQALERYTLELEESKKNLEEFNAIASHDLKEPLRKISVFGEMLAKNLDGQVETKEKEYLSKIIKASERMEQLITHLLDFSKAGIKSLQFEKIDLKCLIEEATHFLEVMINQRKGSVKILIPHKYFKPLVYADQNQMHQLFQNMISNSIKYHRPGVPPEVNILISPQEKGLLRIHIQDNGIGIANSHIQKIFKPFERLHGRSEYEGVGMGLSICQKIITRHGGHIEVNSQPGQGSNFIITLPIRHLSENGNNASDIKLNFNSKIPTNV